MMGAASIYDDALTGECVLREHARTRFPRRHTQVGERIHHFCGYGHSNVTVLEADSSLILVDTLDSPDELRDVLDEMARFTDKPVRTVIYTHGHPDHRGGAGAVRDMVRDVIAFAPCKPSLPYFDRIDCALMRRGRYQHGYGLTDEEAICQGIGPREGKEHGQAGYDFVSPTRLYRWDRMPAVQSSGGGFSDGAISIGDDGVSLTIDGVCMRLIPTPGETDDALTLWLPDRRVAITGDIYYGCWPNLYAIRGTQYRDVACWIESLGAVLNLEPEVLLPGHMEPILDAETVRARVESFRDAIQWVFNETLACIDEGLTLEQTVARVQLPSQFAADPHLGEFYGTVEWSVKSIYVGYVGWFDGGPVRLAPLPQEEFASELRALIGEERLRGRIKSCCDDGAYQLALQLMDLLPSVDDDLHHACLIGRARQMTSANARHYLMASARFGALGQDV